MFFKKTNYVEKMVLNWNEIHILYKRGDLKKYITDDNKNSLLERVSQNGHLELVKYLVEKCGANVRSGDDSAVRCASYTGHLEIVKYLVEKCGADVRSGGDSAVRWASVYGHLELVKYLVEKCGADFRSENDWAVQFASTNGHLEVVKYLINHGAVLLYPNPRYNKYLLICERSEEKRRERASKRIYFWWVQVCYDVKRPCGNRMMKRNYEEYKKML